MATASHFAVVGATGVVGREILSALAEHDVPSENVTLLGSERSEAAEVEYAGDSLPVEKVESDSFRGVNVVLLATPLDVSQKIAPQAQAAGAWVVDVSPAFRTNPNVPLVLPVLNRDVLKSPFKGRIVAVPSPVTAAAVTALEPLRAAFGIDRAFITALIGASSAGRRGVDELERQVGALMSGREGEPSIFPHRLGFNLIPQVGDFVPGDPFTGEERAWQVEALRLWGNRPGVPAIGGTAIQVPTFYGHALSIAVQLREPVHADRVREVLQKAPGLKVLDVPGEKVYPMPMLVAADPTVHVGRIRQAPGEGNWFELFAVVDNAGRGAALNAVDAALALLELRA